MSSNKDEAAQAATDRIKAAALSAAKGLSRAQAERTAAAAARNVNAYGQKEEGPSRWQERKEAKRQPNFLNHGILENETQRGRSCNKNPEFGAVRDKRKGLHIQICHKHGVIHRDLKPENFLFANKKENSPLKAIDFGLSVFFKPGDRFSEIVGSPYYMAPEVLKRNYGPEIDVWSVGVILYLLLCGIPPFWAESEQGVAQAILRGLVDFKREPWPKISEAAKSLVRQKLEPDPKLRLTAQQVIGYKFDENERDSTSLELQFARYPGPRGGGSSFGRDRDHPLYVVPQH